MSKDYFHSEQTVMDFPPLDTHSEFFPHVRVFIGLSQ